MQKATEGALLTRVPSFWADKHFAANWGLNSWWRVKANVGGPVKPLDPIAPANQWQGNVPDAARPSRVVSDPDRESFVALLDVLGFRQLVRKVSLEALAASVKQLPPKDQRRGVHRIQFSDTVLLYTEGREPEQLLPLVAETADMIGENAKRGLLMRAAVTAGPFFRPTPEVFVGQALVRAYELEQDQEWAGGILDPALSGDKNMASAVKDLHDASYLIPYEAPIKGGQAGKIDCLGWPWAYERTSVPIPPESSWEVRRKLNNTNSFLEHWTKLHPGWTKA